jgi:predicted secreted protein
MPEAAKSEEIHLGFGQRHLWNIWPKTTQKGLHEIYLKYKRIKNDMCFTYFIMSWHFDVYRI